MDTTSVTLCIVSTDDVRTSKTLTTWQGYLIFAGLCSVGMVLSWISRTVRKRVHMDQGNLDAEVDAGGKVSCGLIASTIVSQWTWAATILQSTSVTATASRLLSFKLTLSYQLYIQSYGISGAFWYAAGAAVQIILFSMLTIQLKIRAPGAKTFLQMIRVRFGRGAHMVYCVFAIATNIIVTAMLMLGGAAALTRLVDGFSTELVTLLVAATISSYAYMGGLGASLYMSYLYSALILSFILAFLTNMFYSGSSDENNRNSTQPKLIIGSVQAVFESINTSTNSHNYQNSYLTIVSYDGLMFGIINLVGNFGTVFVDQSYWQCGVAAKPRQGVIGFITGGLVWFAVPLTFGTTMGLGYLAIVARGGMRELTEYEISRGLVAPVVTEWMLGRTGVILLVVMIVMIVTSTGSSEVIAMTSILIYDIHQLYIKPYRLILDVSSCLLCGKERGRNVQPQDCCSCISMTYCSRCSMDDELRLTWKRAVMPEYRCPMHGPFRTYNDYLLENKRWCQLWTILAIIPFTLVLEAINVSLGWLYLFMGVVIGSAVIPITLTLYWTRLTSTSVISGAVGGLVLGLVTWLSVAASRPGGLRDFTSNTGSEESMLAGNLVSLLSGGLITIVLTVIGSILRRDESKKSGEEVWELTRDVDNPLRPWSEFYSLETGLSMKHTLLQRPSLQMMEKTFYKTKLLTWVVALSLTFMLFILWPLCALAAWDMNLQEFRAWIIVITVYAFLATVTIIIMPIVTEIYEIYKAVHERRTISCSNYTSSNSALSIIDNDVMSQLRHKDLMTSQLRDVTDTQSNGWDRCPIVLLSLSATPLA